MGIMNLYPKGTKYSYKTYKKNFSNVKHQRLLKKLYYSNENL